MQVCYQGTNALAHDDKGISDCRLVIQYGCLCTSNLPMSAIHVKCRREQLPMSVVPSAGFRDKEIHPFSFRERANGAGIADYCWR